jgi:hypothetical protein
MPSTSKKYQELLDLLDDIEKDLKCEWPIIPRENLEAGKFFLIHALALAKLEPNKSMEACVLQAAREFAQPTHPIGLSKVATMQPNFPLLNLNIFSSVLTIKTPAGDFIEKIRIRFKRKEVARKERQRMDNFEKNAYINFINFSKKENLNTPAKIFETAIENEFDTDANENSSLLQSSSVNIKRYGVC